MYESLIWDYKNADVPSINCAIDIFNWANSFERKNVHEKVFFLNKAILNIFQNSIPNEAVICNDKDPSWLKYTKYTNSEKLDIRRVYN